MNLQENIRRILREETNNYSHQMNVETIQQLVDMEIEQIKEDCLSQNSETDYDSLISFDACYYSLIGPEIIVTEFLKNYSDRGVARVLLTIKVDKINKATNEIPLILELQMRLKKWIGPNVVEVEDIIYI